jgi:hypothetical protein
LRASHRLAVFEIGMNHRGETRELAQVAQPTIAVITNAQREHQEFMRSVDEVAAEHADAIRALPAGGTAVLNADDPHVDGWREAAADAGARIVTFGMDKPADVAARYAVHPEGASLDVTTPEGHARFLLHVPGRHMAANALAAAAVAHAAGLPVTAMALGLERFRPVRGRLVTLSARSGATVIDDTYNANPDSVRAAIDTRISAPPIVGVPALIRCVCGPSSRTAWPIRMRASHAIIRGPTRNEMTSAVIVARTARSEMYENTLNARTSLASHSESQSSISAPSRRTSRSAPSRRAPSA